MKRRELERGGLSAAQAHRAARRAMGNVSLAREDARAVWTWTSVEQLGVDTRYALRALASRPGFSATAVALLALGVGIATAMSTIVDALLFRPVPFRAPTELAAVAMMTERGGPTTVSPAVLRAWRDSPAFAGAEGALTDTAIVEIDGAPQTRGIAHVTPGLFDLLGGVRPLHGRLFDPSEGRGGRMTACSSPRSCGSGPTAAIRRSSAGTSPSTASRSSWWGSFRQNSDFRTGTPSCGGRSSSMPLPRGGRRIARLRTCGSRGRAA
jgi:hypothetical protein